MTADVELRQGTVVTNNVRLLHPLSSGAMGSVWVARHETLDTEVAVKFIHKSMGDDEQLRTRFSLEAKAAARLKSPHVVQMFDHGLLADGRPFMVMELLDGESLAVRLERLGSLPIREAAQVVHQACKALTRAHGLGIVHRDIKPENIFLCRADDGFFVKLLDFGIAKQNEMPEGSKLTGHGVMVGTPEYMSREQVMSSRDVDHHADLWSLAVVAYEMLIGDVPFTGETLGMICIAICTGQFTPPSKKRAELPARVDAWFLRALATDPADRFRSARELSQSFRRVLAVDEAFESDSGEIHLERVAATKVDVPRPELPIPLVVADAGSGAADAPGDGAMVAAGGEDAGESEKAEQRPSGDVAPVSANEHAQRASSVPMRRGPPRALWIAAAAVIAGVVGVALLSRPQSSPARAAAATPSGESHRPPAADRPAVTAPPTLTAASTATTSASAAASARSAPPRLSTPFSTPVAPHPAATASESAEAGPAARPNYGF